MIISKAVPMQISRKRFSDFEQKYTPQDMTFVGWKYDESDPETDLTKKKKKNIQLHFDYIKEYLKSWIEENGGFGGGESTPSAPKSETPTEAVYYSILLIDDDGFEIVDEETGLPKKNPETWNEEEQTNAIDLNQKKGFMEINGGGDYVTDCVFVSNPYIGSITTIVVDNTGRNRRTNETEEEWIQNRVPIADFVLNYGLFSGGNYETILVVPPYKRGVVQILHTENNDIIINASYTDVLTTYIADVIPTSDDEDNIPVEGDITKEVMVDESKKVYVDMNDEHGFLEIVTEEGVYAYTFVFENTELGSMTYIVLDNTNGFGEVSMNYGKVVQGSDEDIESIITSLQVGEKCVVSVFHSLSVDIVTNITKI